MTVRTLFAAAELPESWKAIRAPVPALLLGLVVLGLVFHEEISAAVSVWYFSTAYSHCFFVIPIAGYLAWDRRHLLASVPVEPLPWAALLALPLAAAWLVAERLGIMEGRQLVAMTLLEVLFLTVLGWRMCWAFAAPLLYLYFLVPFGAFVTPQLQDFTTDFINHGLDFLGIPYVSDGYTIAIPEGRFYVAEACAGLRFLIASIAFGALYACLMYRSPLRRTLFMVASVIIPIIANVFRALCIVVLGHLLGSAQAAATDHILYGWIFFSVVILLLILAGLPFREDMQAKPSERVCRSAASLAGAAPPAVRRGAGGGAGQRRPGRLGLAGPLDERGDGAARAGVHRDPQLPAAAGRGPRGDAGHGGAADCLRGGAAHRDGAGVPAAVQPGAGDHRPAARHRRARRRRRDRGVQPAGSRDRAGELAAGADLGTGAGDGGGAVGQR